MPMVDPFAASPGLALLDNRASLRLVTDIVDEDDALALALTCSSLRDALLTRFARLPAGHKHAGKRIRTREAAVVATAERLAWVLGLGVGQGPVWLGWGLKLTGVAARIAWHGGLEALQWARANGCEWDSRTCAWAAYGGHLGVLQWAREHGCEWDSHTCDLAAQQGHLEVIQWARANGCEWDDGVCAEAARGGHLGVIQWARKNGCEWDYDACTAAAEGGHLGVLQWARENGCPWNRKQCLEAARDHSAVCAWIKGEKDAD